MENSILMSNERIDELELNNLKIIQKNDGFCFGGDHVSGGEHHEDDSR